MGYESGAGNRRSAFRVRVSPSQPVTIVFKVPGGPPGLLIASVHDLSVSGVRAAVPVPTKLVPGQAVRHGLINLPETAGVQFEGVIRWQNRNQIGIEFIHLPEAAQCQILRYVFKRQRELVVCLP